MPRKALFTKEEIIQKAYEYVRHNGAETLSARHLATALGSSSRPIFTIFKSMDEIHAAVRVKAKRTFDDYVADVFNYPPAFRECGRRLITFALEEEHLFRLLFLNRENPNNLIDPIIDKYVEDLVHYYQITHEQATTVLKQCWVFICGMAIINNNSSTHYSDKEIITLLRQQFNYVLYFIKSGQIISSIFQDDYPSDQN